MRIGVFGVGAMGSLFASGLSEVANVVLIGEWEDQIRAVRAHGVAVEHVDGSTTIHQLVACLRDEATDPLDTAIVVEKSQQTPAVARHIARVLAPDGLAVTLQNGLGNYETLRDALGPHRAALGITSEGATLLGLARVRHAGNGYTNFGLADGLPPRQRQLLANLSAAFGDAGFPAAVVDEPERLLWDKLAVNAAINPLTALLRVPNGFLLEHPPLTAIMDRAAREVAAVAAAQGIQLSDEPDARARAVARATSANHSSMLQDILRGSPTEIDAICGQVAALGDRHAVATPLNRRLTELVHAAERGELALAQGDVGGLLALLEVVN
jgi:2-dehydropantoate 2-reductase